jgi:hypothetical protein
MPRVGLEPTTPVFERAKTVQALDCAATVIGLRNKLHALNVRKVKSLLPFLFSRPTEACPLTQIVVITALVTIVSHLTAQQYRVHCLLTLVHGYLQRGRTLLTKHDSVM